MSVDIDSRVKSVIRTDERPAPATAAGATSAFLHRALLKIKHVPEQLLDVTMFPIIFTLLFTFIFGGAISGSTGDYVDYLAPGILVQTVVMITMYTATTISNDIKKGLFDRIRALPLWRPSMIVGSLFGDLMRYTIAAAVILVLLVVLGYRPQGGVVGIVGAVLLILVFCFSLSWVWTFFGLTLRTPESVMAVALTVLFPLTFISNVFVPVDTMPGWLRPIAEHNPISYVVDAVRGLLDGEAAGRPLLMSLISSVLMVAVFGPLSMRAFGRKQ